MKVYRVKVDWMENFSNYPRLIAYVDEVPAWNTLRFHRRELIGDGSTIYWAMTESGYVVFNHAVPGNTRGYGGATFSYKLLDGTTDVARGPWSSNSLEMNEFFPACVECAYHIGDNSCGIAANMLISTLVNIIDDSVHGLDADLTFVRGWGGDDKEVDELRRVRLLDAAARGMVIGRYGLAFRRKDCKTLAESQEKKLVRR